MSSEASNSGNQPPWYSNQPPGNSAGPAVREDQIVQAIRFLRDSRTKTATQQEKESFLRQKGLSDAEIAAAISRSSAPPSYQDSAIQRPIYVPPPVVEEPILWSALKSIFGAVGAIAIGVIGYQYYLESTKKAEKEENRDALISSWKPEQDDHVGSERIEKLAASVEALKSEQALRHKELILSIRELTSVMRESQGRKPGGTVFTQNLVKHDEVEKNDKPNQSMPSMEILEEPLIDSVDIAVEVASLVDLGIDSTMQFILSSPEKNKKLNKTNPRFEKFSGNKLLCLVGFKEDSDFFTLGEIQSDKVDLIIAEIKKQRSNKSTDSAPLSSGQQIPPWLVSKPAPVPEIEELNP